MWRLVEKADDVMTKQCVNGKYSLYLPPINNYIRKEDETEAPDNFRCFLKF